MTGRAEEFSRESLSGEISEGFLEEVGFQLHPEGEEDLDCWGWRRKALSSQGLP